MGRTSARLAWRGGILLLVLHAVHVPDCNSRRASFRLSVTELVKGRLVGADGDRQEIGKKLLLAGASFMIYDLDQIF